MLAECWRRPHTSEAVWTLRGRLRLLSKCRLFTIFTSLEQNFFCLHWKFTPPKKWRRPCPMSMPARHCDSMWSINKFANKHSTLQLFQCEATREQNNWQVSIRKIWQRARLCTVWVAAKFVTEQKPTINTSSTKARKHDCVRPVTARTRTSLRIHTLQEATNYRHYSEAMSESVESDGNGHVHGISMRFELPFQKVRSDEKAYAPLFVNSPQRSDSFSRLSSGGWDVIEDDTQLGPTFWNA